MALAESDAHALDIVLEALRGLELEPRLVPHGRIDELRGGLACFDLKRGEGVDAAVLLARKFQGLFVGESRALYRLDYAVRGTVRGVLQGRIISRLVHETRGLLRRRPEGLRWEVPPEEAREAQGYIRIAYDGLPPGPGEVWNGGPHQRLTKALNGDADLMGLLTAFGGGEKSLNLSLASDRWGQSMRICGSLWVKTDELNQTYASPEYLRIVNKIAGHVKEVRRALGGLTF